MSGRFEDFAGLSASEILQRPAGCNGALKVLRKFLLLLSFSCRMLGGVTLVFLGFIGKWHAEVRLNTKDSQGNASFASEKDSFDSLCVGNLLGEECPCGLQSEATSTVSGPRISLRRVALHGIELPCGSKQHWT